MTRQGAALVAAFVLAGVALQADTLVLRDGRRVQGELVAVRDGVIEFEGQRGLFGRERVRYDREDVVRIELDGIGGGNRYDTDRNTDRNNDRNNGRDDRGIDGRPSGMRERSISVEASQPWTDTGISLRPGQTILSKRRAVSAGDPAGRTARRANATRRATTGGQCPIGRPVR